MVFLGYRVRGNFSGCYFSPSKIKQHTHYILLHVYLYIDLEIAKPKDTDKGQIPKSYKLTNYTVFRFCFLS